MARYDLADFDAEAVRTSLLERNVWYAREWKPERLMAWAVGEAIGIPADRIILQSRIEIIYEGGHDFDREFLQNALAAVIVRDGIEHRLVYMTVEAEEYRDYGDEDNRARAITNFQFGP